MDEKLRKKAITIRDETMEGANTAYRIGDMFLGVLGAVDANAPAPEKFTADINVKLASGKSFGKYVNGDTIPARGKTVSQVIIDALTEDNITPPPSGNATLVGAQIISFK